MGWFDGLRTMFFGPRRPALDPDEFTAWMAQRLREAQPGAEVRITTRLSLEVERDGGVQQVFLDNAYRFAANAADDAEREAVIGAWLASATTMSSSDEASADDIVPVLKSPEWFADLPTRDDGTRPEHRCEALNPQLTMVYAIDTPHNVAYVEASWFEQRGIDTEGLRRRAVDNLRAKLPGLEVQRGGRLNMVVAGGYYEASVLLFDDFWAREAGRFRGDPVIAIPARDVLVFGDSTDANAVADLRRHAQDIHADAAYALSPRLFRRFADGRIEVFDA
jgi:uncharacterized protein YtpQ (UPF0354 family)